MSNFDFAFSNKHSNHNNNNPSSDNIPLTSTSQKDLSSDSSRNYHDWNSQSSSDRNPFDDNVHPAVPPKQSSVSSLAYTNETHNPVAASVLDNSTYDSYRLDNIDHSRRTPQQSVSQTYDGYSRTASGYSGNYNGREYSNDGGQSSFSRGQNYEESNYGQHNYSQASYGESDYGQRNDSQPNYGGSHNVPPVDHNYAQPFSIDNSIPNNSNVNIIPAMQPPLTAREKLKKFAARPLLVWFLTLVQVVVFIAELGKMGTLTGSPIQTKPSFNPMIGPSSYVLINMGARFTPCMHAIAGITNVTNVNFPCPNSTSTTTNVCSLSELCGMGGLPAPDNTDGAQPDQWWRFIVPIFLHAGIVHIGFNMLLQWKLGSELEKDIGHIRFFIVYFAAGIGGFVLGGNFTPDGIASTGASGSLFGIIALDLLDLLFNWQLYQSPKKALLMHVIEIVISFAIGLLPGLDNFSHIGGFVIGILLGIALLRSPLPIRLMVDSYKSQNIRQADRSASPDLFPVFSPVRTDAKNGYSATPLTPGGTTPSKAMKINWLNPKKQFVNRAPWWYVWVVARVAAVALVITYFVMLIKNFENGGGNCNWCKYLSCLPIKDWCDVGNITTTTTSSSSTGHGLFLFLLVFHSRSFKQIMGLSSRQIRS